MNFLARLNRPWVHFIVLGILLFYLQGVFFPAPKPVIGPLSDARLEALQQQWMTSVRRPATPEQMERIVQAELDRAGLHGVETGEDLRLRDRGDLRTRVNYGPKPCDASHLIQSGDEVLIGGTELDVAGVTIVRRG